MLPYTPGRAAAGGEGGSGGDGGTALPRALGEDQIDIDRHAAAGILRGERVRCVPRGRARQYVRSTRRRQQRVAAVLVGGGAARLPPRGSISVTFARATGVPSVSTTRPRNPPDPATSVGCRLCSASPARDVLPGANRCADRCDGRNAASTSPMITAPVAMRNEIRNPSMLGTATPPVRIEVCASTMPITALDTEVPMERIRVFRPLAAPVSDGSTAPMIRAGSEEYARPIPAPTTTEMTTVCQAALIRPRPAPYPIPMISMPSISETLGPRRAEIRA